jgi:membrane protease YdiL (CAAX protease family)
MVIGVPIFTTLVACAFLPATRKFFSDERVTRTAASAALYDLYIRMPLATAIGEELTFRSALEAILRRRRSSATAWLVSSLIFGVWHILPTIDRLHTNPGARGMHKGSGVGRFGVVTAVSCATAAAGLVLSSLQRRTGSVFAPIIVHWAINGGAFAGAWLAARLDPAPKRAQPSEAASSFGTA